MKRINVIFIISVVIFFTLLSSAMAEDLPSRWDWRDYGGVTSVRSQGQCGSCWAFATVGTVESAILLHGSGSSNDLSEQHLVSCNTNGWGCAGGNHAFIYYDNTNDSCGLIGTVQESCFPYQAEDVPCSCCDCDRTHEIAEWGYVSDDPGFIPDNQTMKEYIYNYGPISTLVDCNNWTLRLYQNGTVTEQKFSNSPGYVNHAVVIVGWDDDYYGAGVWIIKNSWGTWWQDGGYGYVQYNTGQIGYAACWVDYDGSVGLGCENAIALTPGVPYDGTTVGSTSLVNFYSCASWVESGPEVVHSITTTTSGQDITATLSNLSVDLDVFILDACNPNSCVACGDNAATYSNAPAGTYFIVVDGYLDASGSYTLKVVDPDDTDGDGLLDSWEIFYFGNLDQGATGDYDSDGLNNLEEYQYETDPTDWDTDDDGYSDGDEVSIYETDPNDDNDYPQSPDKPTVITPSNGATGTSTNPAITSSSFSDLNQGGAEGLAAQWQFEGNALDETGNGNDGTIHGAVYTPGKAGQALGFDGVNDYALVSDSSSLDITQTLTMEAWVKLDSYPSTWSLILEKGDSGANRTYGMWIRNTGDILLSYYNDSWYHLYPAGQGFSLGGWHHVVGIIDTVNDYRAIYIDGVLKASDASSIPAMRSDNYPVYIGSCTGTWPTDGTIDEVAVYNRALSESEIQEHYQHGLNGEHNPVGTGGDTHASSGWEVFEDSGLTQLVWSSYDDTAHLTSTTVNSANGTFSGSLSGSTRLTMGNDYWARVRHTDDKGGDSLWSETNRFTTTEVDTDGDGLNDDEDTDDDNDGLIDTVETNTGVYVDENDTGTDPLAADTDGDGVNDGDEVNAGTDPNDDEDYPNSPPAQPEVTSPSNGATGTATNPAVTSSSFSDPDQGAVEGLAAQWQFEGNALDETENGNDGTAHGPSYVAGRAGQALGFDGVNDYALVSDSSSLDITQTLTMEAWVKLDSYPSSWSLILEKGDSGANRTYGMWIRNTGDILLSYYNDSWYHLYPAGQGFSLGGWHHVVGIIDTVNDYRAIYIDGVLKASDTSSIPAMRSDNYPVYIGSCTGTWPTDGTIDEVAVYNRALSESEIQEHYQHGLNGEHNPVGTGGDTHASSGWEVFEDSGLTQLVWSSYDDTAHLTSTTVNSANGTFSGSLSGSTRLTMGNDYWARVRHTDDKGGDSLWSETNRFTTTEVDTDGDGLNDDEDTDDDNDGLIDTVETNTGVYVDENDTGTDPLAADTDGDGVNDGDEVNAGTDPNDDEDYPNSPPAQPEVTSPSNGATGTATNPAVTSSSFSDPDQGAVEGLAAQWQFEGNALDETENGNDGTAHGPSYVAGRAGQALGFDGVNDYALVSDSSSLDITQTLTMEAWVKLDSYPSSWSLILEKGDSGANRTYGMWIRNTGDILLSYYNDSWYHLYPAGQGFSLGGWHHVVGIIDTVNDYRAIYIDGVLKASDTSSIPAMRSDNYPVYIGSCTGTWPTDGTIDEVAVYNRALSESEIQEHYQHGLNGEHNPVGTGGDTHASSGWEVFEDSGLTQLVWSSYDDTAHLTSTTVNSANGTFSGSLSGSTRLTMGNDYWARVRHTDDKGGDSLWSETNRFTTTEVDTDGDGLNDDEDTDDDNDGLIDTVETNTGVYVDENDTGTDPLAADTDGDGVNDGDEVNAGTDPNDDEDYPNSPPAQPEVTSPSNGATGTATNPAVTSSSFSDPDQGAVEGLAAQWQFEGNALDETENGNDGTAHGPSYVAGRAGQALGFDGVNDYALVSDSSSLDITQTLTMEAWVKLDSYPSSWSLILEKGDSGANRTYGMWIRNTGDILLSYYNDSWYHLYPAGQGFSLGGWHHVVGIIDTVNDYRAIYIDGVLKASDTSSIPAMRSDNYPVYIGSCTGTWPTDGTIDEVAVYNRALSESEIQEHYQHGLNGEHNPVGTGGDTHASSGWEVFEDSGLTQLVWSSYDDTAHLTSTTVNSANGTFSGSLSGSTRLTMGEDYWARVRHTDDKGGDSLWSETNRFTTEE